jgi:hypothetical protein
LLSGTFGRKGLESLKYILTYVDMVLLHYFHSFSSKSCETTKPIHWTPPPEGWIMVNVDAAIFEGVNQMGFDLVKQI